MSKSNTIGYMYYRPERFRNADVPSGGAVVDLGRTRVSPKRTDCDYLVLKARVALFRRWIEGLPAGPLKVLDVGGRIQPYRCLFGDRVGQYVVIDPQRTPLVDAIAVGERIPFCSDAFDVIVCTQVLSYVSSPHQMLAEMARVLRPGGMLLLTAPTMFPKHHDERWRFLEEGLRELTRGFSQVEIRPEGHSITGLCRTLGVCVGINAHGRIARVVSRGVIVALNVLGELLERWVGSGDRLVANHALMAIK